MEIRILPTKAEIAKECGDIFINAINEKPNAVLGLATGATPVPTYEYIVDSFKAGKVSFKDVVTFNLDEYVDLPKNDVNSYYSFMMANLFDHVDIDKNNVHLLDGNAADTAKECADYDKLIESFGGIDIQLLGIGTNGHIGFNEPADEFTDGTFKVKLTDSTIKSNIIYFPDGNMPHYALTMGIGSIMKAKKIILIATGSAKVDAVKKLVEGEVDPGCPASILQKHEDVIIFLDEDAAKGLNNK